MKLLYLLPVVLLAACAEEEIPKTELVEPQPKNLRMELTCDDCEIFYQVNTETFYAGRMSSFSFDTTALNMEFANIGFLDSTESAVPFQAFVYVDDVIVIDSIIVPDTFDFGLVGSVWYYFE